mmetsp:Transcript_8922/g.23012  ORF Transcript_8922/g.23012 Transcript_8922/m.23012 type:complete len:260 (+) Transcript_8922:1048-1827(+)
MPGAVLQHRGARQLRLRRVDGVVAVRCDVRRGHGAASPAGGNPWHERRTWLRGSHGGGRAVHAAGVPRYRLRLERVGAVVGLLRDVRRRHQAAHAQHCHGSARWHVLRPAVQGGGQPMQHGAMWWQVYRRPVGSVASVVGMLRQLRRFVQVATPRDRPLRQPLRHTAHGPEGGVRALQPHASLRSRPPLRAVRVARVVGVQLLLLGHPRAQPRHRRLPVRRGQDVRWRLAEDDRAVQPREQWPGACRLRGPPEGGLRHG